MMARGLEGVEEMEGESDQRSGFVGFQGRFYPRNGAVL